MIIYLIKDIFYDQIVPLLRTAFANAVLFCEFAKYSQLCYSFNSFNIILTDINFKLCFMFVNAL